MITVTQTTFETSNIKGSSTCSISCCFCKCSSNSATDTTTKPLISSSSTAVVAVAIVIMAVVVVTDSNLILLAHLSRRLTRWAYRMGLEPASVRLSVRASVRACVHTFKHEYLRDQQADYNQILSEASLGWGKGCIRFWCRSDQNSGFHGNG